MRLSHLLTAAGLIFAAATPVFAQSAGATIKAEFGAVDADRDGFVTIDELTVFLPPIAGRTAATHLVASKDEDGDGRLTDAELSSPVPVPRISIAPEIAIMAPFAEVDANQDGKITVAELDAKAPEPVAGLHAGYFQDVDKNRDGGLSRAEWDANRPVMRVGVAAD